MKNERGRTLALWGAWLQLAPVFGLMGTVVAMIFAFSDVARSSTAPTPGMLANNISIALISTSIGLLFGFIGAVLMGIALFAKEYRAPWFFWFLIVYASLFVLTFSIGTALGIVLLIYLIIKKDEFLLNEPNRPDSS